MKSLECSVGNEHLFTTNALQISCDHVDHIVNAIEVDPANVTNALVSIQEQVHKSLDVKEVQVAATASVS